MSGSGSGSASGSTGSTTRLCLLRRGVGRRSRRRGNARPWHTTCTPHEYPAESGNSASRAASTRRTCSAHCSALARARRACHIASRVRNMLTLLRHTVRKGFGPKELRGKTVVRSSPLPLLAVKRRMSIFGDCGQQRSKACSCVKGKGTPRHHDTTT
jgi:hypothetical protein